MNYNAHNASDPATNVDNAFAPPLHAPGAYHLGSERDGRLYRDGDLLLIFNGAELPPTCVVTGQEAKQSFPVSQSWHPHWVGFLAIPFVFPYFFLGPFLSRRINLELPLAPAIISRHMASVRRGFRILVAGAALFLFWLMLVLTSFASTHIPFLLASLAIGGTGYFLSSRQPVSLSIVAMQQDLLILRGIHPRFLEQAPEWS